MALFSHTHTSSKYYALISIESASVHASLIELTPNIPVKILFTTTSLFGYQKDLEPERYIKAMISTVMEAAMELQSQGVIQHQAHIEEVICILGAPWYVAHTRSTLLSKKDPITVSEKILSDMINNEKKAFQDALKAKAAPGTSEALLLHGSEVVEVSVLETRLNGYSTGAPYGKKAMQIELELSLGLLPSEIIAKTTEVVEKAFQARTVIFHTSILAAYKAIEMVWKEVDRFLLLSVEGEITDASIVEMRHGVEANIFAVGELELVRAIALRQKTSIEEARSILAMYGENKTSTAKTEELKEIVAQMQRKWLDNCKATLRTIAHGKPIPRQIFILSPNPGWITNAISKEEFQELTLSREDITLVTISQAHTKKHCTFASTAPYDSRVALDAIFTHSLKNS